jgi:hypothetical protein
MFQPQDIEVVHSPEFTTLVSVRLADCPCGDSSVRRVGVERLRSQRASGLEQRERRNMESPFRSSEPWTIYIAPFSSKHLSKRVKIAVAWF